MSAEDEKDLAGEAPAEKPKAPAEKAAKEPAAGKKPAAEKAASGKKAAKQPTAEKAEEKPARKPATRRKAAKEPAAAKQPVAAEAPVAKEPAQPAKRSRGATPPARRKVVRAHARYVRTSARKARMVCGHLRGKSVQEARAILAFTPREVARDWSKLLESAVANAESNHELLEDDLIVREAYADEGPTIKRFRPRAMGRATPIRKRTSHLTITLTPGPEPGTTSRRG
jgi:ribosomal protein L22